MKTLLITLATTATTTAATTALAFSNPWHHNFNRKWSDDIPSSEYEKSWRMNRQRHGRKWNSNIKNIDSALIMGMVRVGSGAFGDSFGHSRRESKLELSPTKTPKSPKKDVELYNEKGEEILMDMEDIAFEDVLSGDMDEDFVNDEGGEGHENAVNSKRLIECSAKISLPFSADVAFDAFSDLTRQPSWCNYLHSVEYLGYVEGGESINNENENENPLRQSKWTVGVKGLRFSWTAQDTLIQRPHRIEWESTSGMKNMGIVQFVPNDNNPGSTEMLLSFTFVAPRVVAGLFRRSNKIRKYTEDVLLMNMLTGFRDVVVEEDL